MAEASIFSEHISGSLVVSPRFTPFLLYCEEACQRRQGADASDGERKVRRRRGADRRPGVYEAIFGAFFWSFSGNLEPFEKGKALSGKARCERERNNEEQESGGIARRHGALSRPIA